MRKTVGSFASMALLAAAFGCIGPTETTLPDDEQVFTGGATFSTTTSGDNPDPNGYLVVMDEGRSETIGVNDSVTFGSLGPGSYQVTLSDVESNCVVQGVGATRGFTVQSGVTTEVLFTVHCP